MNQKHLSTHNLFYGSNEAKISVSIAYVMLFIHKKINPLFLNNK
jgi:hypothetical protein